MQQAIAGAAVWYLGVLLVIGATGKASHLRSRTSQWHPIFVARPALRQFASLLTAAALGLDLLALTALLLSPRAGGFISGLVVLGYTSVAFGVQGTTDTCHCLGQVFDGVGRRFLLLRNSSMLVAAMTLLANGPSAEAAADVAATLTGIGLLALLGLAAGTSRRSRATQLIGVRL